MKALYIFFLAIIFSNAVNSQNQLNPRYVHLNDTTFNGVVEFCLNVNVDSFRYGETLVPILAIDTNRLELNVDSMKEVIFYNFWFTSCSPCIAEMPMLDTLVKLYHDKVDFISITWESEDKLKLFLKDNQFNFRHFLVSKKGYLEDIGVVHGYPTTIITFHNKIVYCKYGGQDSNSIYFEAVNRAERSRYEAILNELVKKIE